MKNKSKRVKINFDSINGGNYTKIPAKDIAETNARISKAMKEFKMQLN